MSFHVSLFLLPHILRLQVFPSGMGNWLGLPLALHNRYFAVVGASAFELVMCLKRSLCATTMEQTHSPNIL